MNPPNRHLLAHKLRRRLDGIQPRAAVLEEVQPLLTFLDGLIADPLSQGLGPTDFRWIQNDLVRSLLRLGLDDKARRLAERLKGTKDMRPIHEIFADEAVRLGQYDEAMAILDAKTHRKWENSWWWFSGQRVAHLAVMNGDLDEASRLLDQAADFQADQVEDFASPNLGRSWMQNIGTHLLRANGELAALAHVMEREDLVLPALFRARFLIEGGTSVSDRPLPESPAWIEKGQSRSIYLIHAIAASGRGEVALQLLENRDIHEIADDMVDYWGEQYALGTLYLALAYGGCPEQAVALAKRDKTEPMHDERFLSFFAPVLFHVGEDQHGTVLAEDCLERLDQRVSLELANDFAGRLAEVGQDSLAAAVGRRMFQFAREHGDAFPDKYYGSRSLGHLLKRVPAEEREAAIEWITAKSPTDPTSIYSRHWTLSVLGIDAKRLDDDNLLQGKNGYFLRKTHDHFLEAGDPDGARRIFEGFVAKASVPECDHRVVKMALNLCAEYCEMDHVDAILRARPNASWNELCEVGRRFASQEGVHLEDALTWAKARTNPVHQLAAAVGILSQYTSKLVLCNSTEVNDFPNAKVTRGLGLYAYLTEGFGFGC